MLSLLLIIIDIFVGICLVTVVLMQRSEGGAFGMGGGPTGMISARGAGDLLTRTTWVLFAIFLALSLGLTLLGAHDKATSSVLQQLKGQIANPAALSQPSANSVPAAPTPTSGAPAPSPFLAPGATNPLSAPAPQAAPPPPVAPTATTSAAATTTSAPAKAHEHKPASTPAAAPAAPPTLEAPPPAPATPAPAPATQP
jgi:preprotein translocase subunit SecG